MRLSTTQKAMAVLIGALLIAGGAVAGVRGTRKTPVAQPTESPTAQVTMTFTGLPPYSPTPSESPPESPSSTVLPGETESPSPSDTALPRTGDGADGLLPLVMLTLMIAIGGAALLVRAH